MIKLKDIDISKNYCITNIKLGNIIVASENMKNIYKKLRKIHEYPEIPVLIQGRTGTGKEIIASYIHFQNKGMEKPYVAINCAAIDKNLFESELFGYVKGAFTGADPHGKDGKIKLAEGGSLFLDEITEILPDLQTKLLRILQEKEYYKVGGNTKYKVNTRIICATNKNIKRLIREGKFREDLYYRLDVCKVIIPTLNDRKEEIIPLSLFFINLLNKQKKNPVKSIETKSLEFLKNYNWIGNVRQLKNAITKAMLFNDSGILRTEDFSFLEKKESNKLRMLVTDNFLLPEKPFNIEKFTKEIIIKALDKFNGNKSKTAEFLGLNRLQLYNRYKTIVDKYTDK